MKVFMNKPPVVKVFRSKDGVHFVFWCPSCNKFHFHGAAELGGRVAHCKNESSPHYRSEYILKEYTKKEIKELQLPISL